jgi:hypothetical protein
VSALGTIDHHLHEADTDDLVIFNDQVGETSDRFLLQPIAGNGAQILGKSLRNAPESPWLAVRQ